MAQPAPHPLLDLNADALGFSVRPAPVLTVIEFLAANRSPARLPRTAKCSNVSTINSRHLRSPLVTKTIVSSREFNQDAGGAKRAARKGPVIITDRGRPAHVLLSFEAYQKLTRKPENIIDLLAMPGVADIPFEAPRMGPISRPADLA
jgi:prevent-host-death family protein